MEKTKRKYPYDLKKQVVEMYFEGHSADVLVNRFDLSNRRMVFDWVSRVRKNGYEGLNDLRGISSKGKKKKETQSLEEEFERLKLENEYLKKLLDLKRG